KLPVQSFMLRLPSRSSSFFPYTTLFRSSTLPSAGVGALALLMAFGYDFSLIALIGVILLIGIVKKNGIMMVDFAIAAERDQHLRSEAHTSELQSRFDLVCRLPLEKKNAR